MAAIGMAGMERGLTPDSAMSERMPGGIALSASLHLAIGAIVALGLPTLFHHQPPQDTPIAVEFVTLAPETRATRPNPFRPRREAKPDTPVADNPAPKPEPKPEPPKPQPQPPASAEAPPPSPAPPQPAPPKPGEAPPPPLPKPTETAALMPPPPPKPKPEPKKDVSQAFDTLLKNLAPQDAPRRAEAPRDPKQRPEKRDNPAAFDSLLKNLTPQQTAQAEEAPPRPQRTRPAAATASSQPRAPLGSQLTASELDLIKRQISECWNVPAGARDAQDLVIEVKVEVNVDGTVQQARIVDLGRYAADISFRAAADSAIRAVRNPRCSPLRLPPEKYDSWRSLDLFFNPKDVL
ncbi:MAG: hypothetical protein JO038_05995 [Alphaproteobacteria bacterium]|nr:hypothetical protein [Alphaproteobacteria bacterium]